MPGPKRATWQPPLSVAIGLCALAGLVSRCFMLRTGIWRDEATSYFTALQPSVRAVVERISYVELNPPGFYVLLHFWMRLLGHGDVALKLLPLIFGFIALGVSFAVARRVTVSDGAFVFIAAMLSANFLSSYYAAELRPYSIAECFVLIGMLCAIRTLAVTSKPDIRFEIAGALALTAAAYVSYIAVLAIVGIAVAALALGLGPARLARFEGAFVILPGILSLPLVPLIRIQHAYNFLSLSLPLTHRPLTYFTLIAQALPMRLTDTNRLPQFLGACVLVLAMYVMWRRRLAVREPAGAAVVLVGLTFLIACGLEAAFSLESVRYAMPVVPLGSTVVALALVDLFELARERLAIGATPARAFVASVTAVVLVTGVVLQVQSSSHPKSALAGLPERLPRGPGIAYLVTPDFDAQTFAFYRGSTANVYGFARWDRPDVFDLRGYREIWNSPAAIETAMQRIRGLSARGISELVLVRLGPLDRRISNGDGIEYSKTDALRDRLLATYPIVARGCYGTKRIESYASVDALAIGPGAPPATLDRCVR